MSDLIFRNELPLEEITDGEAEDFFLTLFRNNPGALPEKWRQAALQYAAIRDHADRIKERADAAERKAKLDEWVSLFLDTRKSAKTRENYQAAIERLKAFCLARGIEPSSLTYEQARQFTTSTELSEKKAGGRRSEQSIRVDIAAISSLYSELDRLSEGKIRNPFIRIDTKPSKQRASGKAVPTAAELEAILENTQGEVRAAIACMAYRGFRIGALAELRLATRDGKTTFTTSTKGKAQSGTLPQAALEAIDRAGLSRKAPFAELGTEKLQKRIERELDRLAARGLVAGHSAERMINHKPKDVVVADYSCHSFRHFYAVQEYGKDRDIERVRRLLNHADLNTTQAYLQSLGCIEE